jgi:hypothetical protein
VWTGGGALIVWTGGEGVFCYLGENDGEPSSVYSIDDSILLDASLMSLQMVVPAFYINQFLG